MATKPFNLFWYNSGHSPKDGKVVVYSSQDGAIERRILIGLIQSKSILSRIAARWDNHLFRSSIANIVAEMCVSYYRKHNEAPERAIDAVYEAWAELQTNTRLTEEINSYLEELGREFNAEGYSINPEHLIDVAGRYFQEVRQENLHSGIGMALQVHDSERVDKLINAYRKVELGAGSGINLFNDEEELQSLFLDAPAEILAEYDGAIGEFFDTDLSRDSFVIFLGSAKSGKSFMLHEIAYTAMCQRRKVAYFEAGDMSKRQVEKRFFVRAARHPIKSTLTKDPRWPCTVKVPQEMVVEIDEDCGKNRAFVTKTDTEIFNAPLDFETAIKSVDELRNKIVRSNKSHFKLSVHSNSSLSIDTIKSMLDEWAQDDWFPDLIVVDYSDLLLDPIGSRDERDSINRNWKQMRKLSEDLHCLVLSASQGDTDSYSAEILTKKNFSGDRRKNDHVTAMYAINTSDEEKERGVCRLNVVNRRDGESVNKRCLYIAQCLPLGRPIVLSSW